jgi:hypothetical protein
MSTSPSTRTPGVIISLTSAIAAAPVQYLDGTANKGGPS